MMKEDASNAFDRGRVFSKRKRPNQDCIEALIDQRDEARAALSYEKMKNRKMTSAIEGLVVAVLSVTAALIFNV